MKDSYGFIALICLLVGGVDLGILGLINVDLITAIFGNLLGRLIFIVIGVAAGYKIYEIYLQKFKSAS